MTAATLSIDLEAIVANWRALDAMSASTVETGAVVKADGYGLGAGPVAGALAQAGVQVFFVAEASEGHAVRHAVGHGAKIYVFSGHMAGDTGILLQQNLTPMLNSLKQVKRHLATLGRHPFGFQIDTGMNRLGMEAEELREAKKLIGKHMPELVQSHLACADEPDHAQNAAQLNAFKYLTDGWNIRRSLAATGGIMLGPDFHFGLTRPGVGLYGGLPFAAAQPVVYLSIPVIQTRDVAIGETVGYGGAWAAKRASVVATIGAGYSDGLIRAMGPNAQVWAGNTACPVIGRISMDMITVDVTDLAQVPDQLDILGPQQNIDNLAHAAGTIGYEILTSLGARYKRVYKGE